MLDTSRIAPERFRPIRRSEYDRMVDLGLFDGERVELLQGVLVQMSPQGAAHAHAVRRLMATLVPVLAGRAIVQAQLPLAASEESVPEPDLAVVPLGDYSRSHPSSANWVIEVADSSIQKDRYVKSEIYAAAGVPEYWLVDLMERTVEVRTAPSGGRYTHLTTHRAGETLSPAAFPDVKIDLGEILPS
ncbi:MAG: Uma2 family endonuclease [Myxococcales bacterium]|nr:Uma2 family endonuclease [Myxococcales bacterium]